MDKARSGVLSSGKTAGEHAHGKTAAFKQRGAFQTGKRLVAGLESKRIEQPSGELL